MRAPEGDLAARGGARPQVSQVDDAPLFARGQLVRFGDGFASVSRGLNVAPRCRYDPHIIDSDGDVSIRISKGMLSSTLTGSGASRWLLVVCGCASHPNACAVARPLASLGPPPGLLAWLAASSKRFQFASI